MVPFISGIAFVFPVFHCPTIQYPPRSFLIVIVVDPVCSPPSSGGKCILLVHFQVPTIVFICASSAGGFIAADDFFAPGLSCASTSGDPQASAKPASETTNLIEFCVWQCIAIYLLEWILQNTNGRVTQQPFLCGKLRRDADDDRLRGNAVGDDLEVAVPHLHGSGNVERGGDHSVACRHPHAAVIVRPSIEDVPGERVGDPDQGVVGGRLSIITVGCPLRKAVKLRA